MTKHAETMSSQPSSDASEPLSLSAKIFKSFKQMFAGTGINTALSILSGYFYALILGPAVYGIWQTARVFISYGSFVNLGTPYIIQRDYPALLKEGKEEEAEKIARQGISFGFLTFPLAALIVLAIAMAINGDWQFKKSLATVGLWFLVTIPAGVGTILNKAVNDYKTVGIGVSLLGVGSMLAVPFIYFYGLDALLIGFLLTAIVQSWYYYRNRPIAYKWHWDNALLKGMVFTAFPLFLVHVAASVFASIDRLIIAGMLDFKEVGLYSLSTFIASPINLVVSSLSVVLFTQLNARYGKSQAPHVIEKHVFIPQEIFSNLLPPIIGMGLVALPLFTDLFLPQYAGGIAAAQINIFAVFFFMLATFSANALFVLNKQRYSAMAFFTAGLIKTSGSFFAIKMGYGIAGVAFFSVIGYFVYDSLMLYFVNKNLGFSLSVYIRRLAAKLSCPLAILLFSIAYVWYQQALFAQLKVSNVWIQLAIGELLILAVGMFFMLKAYRHIRYFLIKQ